MIDMTLAELLTGLDLSEDLPPETDASFGARVAEAAGECGVNLKTMIETATGEGLDEIGKSYHLTRSSREG
jgi:hypothetical protein